MILSINRLRSGQHRDLNVPLPLEMVSQATGYGILTGTILESCSVMSSLIKKLLVSELVELQALWNRCQKDKIKWVEVMFTLILL